MQGHGHIVHVIFGYLYFLGLVLCNDLDDKVRIGLHSELLEAHVYVRIDRLEVFEFFTSDTCSRLSVWLQHRAWRGLEKPFDEGSCRTEAAHEGHLHPRGAA